MPIYPRPTVSVSVSTAKSDTDTPFDVTLAVAAAAEDAVLVPALKKGRALTLINEGPGSVAIKFDAAATATDTLLAEGDTYSESNLEISTKVSFINVTVGQTPRVHGQLLSGPA